MIKSPDRIHVEQLIQKAQHELKEITPPISVDNDKQEEANNILKHSVSFADNVIKRLVAHTVEKDIDELFDECLNTQDSILITEGCNDSKKKYTLRLDLVDHDYMLDLKHFKDHTGVKERIVFLLNTVKVLFCPIKDHMKKWARDNDTNFNYVLQIGINTTLFLDRHSKQRIGIILTCID
jgi:hypothetical protein